MYPHAQHQVQRYSVSLGGGSVPVRGGAGSAGSGCSNKYGAQINVCGLTSQCQIGNPDCNGVVGIFSWYAIL